MRYLGVLPNPVAAFRVTIHNKPIQPGDSFSEGENFNCLNHIRPTLEDTGDSVSHPIRVLWFVDAWIQKKAPATGLIHKQLGCCWKAHIAALTYTITFAHQKCDSSEPVMYFPQSSRPFSHRSLPEATLSIFGGKALFLLHRDFCNWPNRPYLSGEGKGVFFFLWLLLHKQPFKRPTEIFFQTSVSHTRQKQDYWPEQQIIRMQTSINNRQNRECYLKTCEWNKNWGEHPQAQHFRSM